MLRVLAFATGLTVTVATCLSAVTTVVVPRGVRSRLSRAVFGGIRRLFDLWGRFAPTYAERDRAMALYAPISLVLLPAAWLSVVLLAYTLMFWALGVQPLRAAFETSGSSLLTLGFAQVHDLPSTMLAVSEAVIGLILLALLITYLPSMYAAFQRRELRVTMLTIQAGDPPTVVELIQRFHILQDFSALDVEVFRPWSVWFVDVEESHTSLAAMPFFRSPSPRRSWITAAGTVLDVAALHDSTLDVPRSPIANLMIRSGYLSLRAVADTFAIPHDPDPHPGDPISVTRAEYDELYDTLAGLGMPLKPDRDQCWRDFSGWRVNYDTVLTVLAGFVVAPPAPWISDRGPVFTDPAAPRPGFHRRRPKPPAAARRAAGGRAGIAGRRGTMDQ